jgi:hypothetical protein
MTKQEFIEKWDYLIPEFYHVELAEDFNSVIKQAIAEHEAKFIDTTSEGWEEIFKPVFEKWEAMQYLTP